MITKYLHHWKLLQKEKLFEDDSENRVRACPENDFSFRYVICAQHCNGLFTLHHSLFTHRSFASTLFPQTEKSPVLDIQKLIKTFYKAAFG